MFLERAPGALVRELRFDRTGSRLATAGGVENTIHLWDLERPREAAPLVLRRGETLQTNGVAFHPSGDWLASTDERGLALWSLDGRYPGVLRGHSRNVFGLAFDPAGRWLASSSHDGAVRLWPLSGEPSRILYQGWKMWSMAVDPAGSRLAVAEMGSEMGKNQGVRLIPLDSGPTRLLPTPGGAFGVAFGPDGRLVAGGTLGQGKIRIWDLAIDELLWDLDLGSRDVFALRFVSGNRLLSGSKGGIHSFRLDDRTSELLFDGMEGKLHVPFGIRDGRLLRISVDTLTFEAEVFLHDFEEGRSRRILASHGEHLTSLAIAPGWEIVVTVTPSGVVQVGPMSGEPPHELWGHEGTVFSLAVSPDGEWIASGGHDGAVRLWPMPDLDRPPLHTLPYEELLEKLRALTNLRVVPDNQSATGYRVVPGSFSGWKTVSTW